MVGDGEDDRVYVVGQDDRFGIVDRTLGRVSTCQILGAFFLVGQACDRDKGGNVAGGDNGG